MWVLGAFITAALFGFGHTTPIDDIKGVLSLLEFVGDRNCLEDCSAAALVIHIYDLFTLGQSPTTFSDLCKSYKISSSCVEAREGCASEKEVFRVLTSGLSFACELERPVFDLIVPCVERSHNPILSECERGCELYANLSQWTSGKKISEVARESHSLLYALEDAGQLCSSFSCYLLCAERQLANECGRMGPRLLEIVTRPLMSLASDYRTATLAVKQLVRSVAIPPECAAVVFDGASTFVSSDKIDFSEGILRNLSRLFDDEFPFLLDPAVDPFDQSLGGFSPADLAENGIPEHSVTSVTVFSIVFIALLLSASLVGLTVAVVWCCSRTQMSASIAEEPNSPRRRNCCDLNWLFGGQSQVIESEQRQLTPERMERLVTVPGGRTPSRADKPFVHVE